MKRRILLKALAAIPFLGAALFSMGKQKPDRRLKLKIVWRDGPFEFMAVGFWGDLRLYVIGPYNRLYRASVWRLDRVTHSTYIVYPRVGRRTLREAKEVAEWGARSLT